MILSPQDMLCFSLYSTAHAMQAAYKPLLEPLGITYPQFLVLSTLWTRDGLTVGAIGEEMMLESSTLTPLLKKLESKGLVSRIRDKQDERKVRIWLTEDGQDMRSKTEGFAECILESSCLSADEAIKLRDDVLALRDKLTR